MTSMKRYAWFMVFALGLSLTPAHAQQQKWAAAYVDWTFPHDTRGVGAAQDLWTPQAGRASFFTLNFDFVTGQGGYIGLQSDETGAGNARFSLWNTTVARGQACRPFDGEGEGMTCVVPVSIDPGGVYRVRIAQAEADATGQWWVGFLQEKGGLEREIGAIRTPRIHREIASAGMHNFSEFWGNAVAACRDVPLTAAAFAAPILTRVDGEPVVGANPNGTRPEENRCVTGRERIGAAVTHTPLTLRGAPAMVIALGGAPNANRALAQRVGASAPTH